MEYPTTELMTAVINRLAEEAGVEVVSVTDHRSSGDTSPYMLTIVIREPVKITDPKVSCADVAVTYSFDIAYGPKLGSVIAHFQAVLLQVRNEAIPAIEAKLGEELSVNQLALI